MSDVTTRNREVAVAWRTDLTIVGAAVVCPLVLWLCAVTWGQVELLVTTGGQTREVGVVAVATTAGLSALAALFVLRKLERRTRAAVRIWTALAALVFLLSLVGPLAAESPSATGTLAAMHAIVAAVVITAGRRSRQDRVEA